MKINTSEYSQIFMEEDEQQQSRTTVESHPSVLQQVHFTPITNIITVKHTCPHYNYILLTNSLHLTVNPLQTLRQDEKRYKLKPHPAYPHQIEILKFCLLVMDGNERCRRILGEVRVDQPKNHVMQSSIEPSLQTELVKVTSQKDIKEVLTPAKRPFMHSQLITIMPSSPPNSKTTQKPGLPHLAPPLPSLPRRPSFSLQTHPQPMEPVYLYVTKFQKQIEDVYLTNMFHEYVWSEKQIEFAMQQVEEVFGRYQAIVQKRRHLKFAFRRKKGEHTFWDKWKETTRQILIRRGGLLREGKVVNYYIWSRNCLLSNQQLTSTLFQLPSISPIISLTLSQPWIVVCSASYVLFVHNYKPMDLFHHHDNICPVKAIAFEEEKVVLILTLDGSIMCWHLGQKDIVCQKVIFFPFLKVKGVTQVKNKLFVAGLDIDKDKDNKDKPSLKRKIYQLDHNIKEMTHSVKSAHVLHSFQVIQLTKDQSKTAALNLSTPTNSSPALLCCTILQNFYLFSTNGHLLIQVTLKSRIEALLPVPFLFNLCNFIVLTKNGQIVRLGIQSHGQALGSEVQRMAQGQFKGLSLAKFQGSKWEVLVHTLKDISKRSYLKQQEWNSIVRQKQGEIALVAGDKIGIAFVVDLQHSYELRYLEM